MLLATRSRNLPLLQETLKAAGHSMDVRRFKLCLRQIKSIVDNDQWKWLDGALKRLHKNFADPGRYWLTSYQFARTSNEPLKCLVATKLSETEYERLQRELQQLNMTQAELIRDLIRGYLQNSA